MTKPPSDRGAELLDALKAPAVKAAADNLAAALRAAADHDDATREAWRAERNRKRAADAARGMPWRDGADPLDPPAGQPGTQALAALAQALAIRCPGCRRDLSYNERPAGQTCPTCGGRGRVLSRDGIAFLRALADVIGDPPPRRAPEPAAAESEARS